MKKIAIDEAGHAVANKKRIAREYLYFLGWSAVGLSVFPFIVFVVLFIVFPPLERSKFGEFYREFYRSLCGRGFEPWTGWLLVWIPYVFFQFIRSIVWALKTVRSY